MYADMVIDGECCALCMYPFEEDTGFPCVCTECFEEDCGYPLSPILRLDPDGDSEAEELDPEDLPF